ncbi:uncharacterized protein M421DRAFT_7535 [Didymella exigua CBS 183.55]|uniref:Uncharacterized protein n=1 Tax=Didymella exigua CBS 183.55 TaxID=1150837 RepID=A0A6A5RE61_9PLEO|nr:uncharacterized protein M421DRAFT_7535 [Didymella exigua CBS 183.55]KAF1925763.1 hypothetical protein M421DRAFT_7535 [Didymella exigua CBS 183.55]
MKFHGLLMMLGAALATSSKTIPLTRDLSRFGPALCRPPHCAMERPRVILRSLAAGYYFQQVSGRRVLLMGPRDRVSSGTGRWVFGSDRSCCKRRNVTCRFIPYEAAKSIYDQYISLSDSEIDDLLCSRNEDPERDYGDEDPERELSDEDSERDFSDDDSEDDYSDNPKDTRNEL